MNEILQKLNLLIEENFENSKFSIDEICTNLGLSRSQLHRFIKEQTQLSTSLYIRKIKLQKAKQLLVTTQLRISEIAYSIGIDSPQSFSKYFTEEFGISPSDFRKSQENLVEEMVVEITPKEERVIQKKLFLLSQKHKFYRFRWLGLGLLLLTILGLGFWLKYSLEKNANVEGSIAILPFKNLGKPENVFFSDGVMEQIHTSLAVIDNLKIISKTSSLQYRNTQKTIPQIGKELNVNYILEGTVLQLAQKVRITVELSRANDDMVVWSKNYEGEMKDIFGYMSTVAKEIANELNQKLSISLSKKLEKVPTQNINAYNEYLQGQQLMKARTKEKMEAAILKFEKAIGLDPNFANAYAQKASAYYLLGEDSHIDWKASIKLVEQNALTAIQLDAENGMAYANLAKVYQRQNKWEQANASFKIALKNSPNDAQINYWYSLMLRSVGQVNKAVQYSTKAITLDPVYPTVFVGHVGNYMYAGKMKLAQKALEDGKPLFGEFYMYHWASGFYCIFQNDYKTAQEEFNEGFQMSGIADFKRIAIYCQAKLGHKKVAETYLQSLEEIPENYESFATIYAGLGNTDKCIEYLQKEVETSNMPNYIKVSPLFAFLHSDARFEAILQEIGLANPTITML